jgi:DNA-directed RNA polymerase subunit RPC12/RpoP
MAMYEEDFLRCQCGGKHFVEKEVLIIHSNAKKYKRDFKTISLPKNLLEKEIKYICDDCGKELEI